MCDIAERKPLDVAYCLDLNFLKELHGHCKWLAEDFFLLGETLHGDYNKWMNPEMLDSVTNYECYKGLFSSAGFVPCLYAPIEMRSALLLYSDSRFLSLPAACLCSGVSISDISRLTLGSMSIAG